MTWPDGRRYEGEWVQGRITRGTMRYTDGSTYDGGFENEIRHGEGTCTWSDGRQYVGAFKDGVPDGRGTMTWPDGRRYEGEWVQGWIT